MTRNKPSLSDDLAKLQAQHDRDRAEIARLDAALVQARATLARVEEWTHIFGAALKPRAADTYGEGIRDAKAQVSLILRSDPHAIVKRAELDRMRPVYEAVKEWRAQMRKEVGWHNADTEAEHDERVCQDLIRAFDAAEAEASKEADRGE